MSVVQRTLREPNAKGRSRGPLGLALIALGVVFGDIGTSPLYAFETLFTQDHPVELVTANVLGSLSLIFWTLTLVVSIKYVLIVMRADNDGEGGIMALIALTIIQKMRHQRGKVVLVALGILGASLFFGDSMITPAISVLSAVEGVEVAVPGLKDAVVPIAIAVLAGLFLLQKRGTGVVGRLFGPVMLIWFLAIGLGGLFSIIANPMILKSISPTYAIEFFIAEPLTAYLALGAVILCVTGAEALYADMGQIGVGPIRISWFSLVTPALYLNYLGQGALVIRDPSAVDNPFYLLFPSWSQLPMVVLATLATVIASQAVISGAFSLSVQAMKLRFMPRMKVRHTSSTEFGEVYVPFINWLLFAAVVGLIIGFQNSANLAGAYGIAVSGTFVITTILIAMVARKRWRRSPWLVYPIMVFFLIVDLAFFTSNLTKFTSGGWFPLTVALIVFFILMTWSQGRRLLARKLGELSMSDKEVRLSLRDGDVARTPGTRVFLSLTDDVPLAFSVNTRQLHSMAEQSILVSARSERVPVVADEDRLVIREIAPGVKRVVVRTGFMQRLWTPRDLEYAKTQGLDFTGDVTFVVHSYRVDPSERGGMARWRKYCFGWLLNNSRDPVRYYKLPREKTVEYTSVISI